MQTLVLVFSHLWPAWLDLAGCAVAFFVLAVLVKGAKGAVEGAEAAAGQTRVNLVMSLIDQLSTSPLLGLAAAWAMSRLAAHGLRLAEPGLWAKIGAPATVFATIFFGDFIAYWRHRLQHTRWLWPAHAVHHSDDRLTWFSLERMHPLDRVTSQLDTVILGSLGLPFWALAANVAVRHYYGYFVHADLPWTLGKLSWVFNSPAMHRWHHVRDVDDSGSNFATVFSVFDRAFGTFRQPGPCDQPLGVREEIAPGALGQYLHPFRDWARMLGLNAPRGLTSA